VRRTPRSQSSKFVDALGGRNLANLATHLEVMIEQAWRYGLGGHNGAVWRAKSNELGDALGGHNGASLEMHLDTVIKRV
jgi:hypothetical protein